MTMGNTNKYIKYSIFRLYNWTRGYSTFKHLKDLDVSQWKSPTELKQLQWNKLKKLLDYSYTYVPYYKEKFDELCLTPDDIKNPDDFRKLPILTKEDIEKNISRMTSLMYDQKDLIKNSTGGSTGRTLNFYLDRRNIGVRWAIASRGNRMAGLDIGDNHAYLWGSPFDASLQKRILNNIYNKMIGCDLFLSSYDLSEDNMFLYAKQLQKYNPKVIIGYSSSLYAFAKFLQKYKIEGINPKSIIASADVLYDYQRKIIEDVFCCKIFNRYGCREFNIIAQECCEHNGLHINVEHIYMECLTEDKKSAELGEKGTLIITDLDNYGMPFIRYNIGDMGELIDNKCKCGRGLPQLKYLEGRVLDIIVGSNGKLFNGHFFSILLRTAVEGIKQFQVVQKSKDELNIKIIVDETFRKESIDLLTTKIHENCGNDMNVKFEFVDEIPLTKSGKFRFVISECSPYES